SSNPGETDMLLRNATSGAFQVYDIRNNAVVSSSSLGTVGIEWQVVGFGPVSGAGHSDMVLRNITSGAFEVYDIANNQITAAASLGSVGSDWQVVGIAANSTPAAMGTSDGSNSQLVQAMAGFGGGGGAANSATVPLGADASQQQFLTTPQHA